MMLRWSAAILVLFQFLVIHSTESKPLSASIQTNPTPTPVASYVDPVAVTALSPQNEDHLRMRIRAYYRALEKGDLDTMTGMVSQKGRDNSPVSPEEQSKMKRELEYFATHEKPRGRVKSLTIEGNRAMVKMDVSIQLPEGGRKHDEVYDLWVFENGDWYLRDGNRISPEFLPKD